MSDIFISYAKEDRDWVVSFADALRQQGWTVWWDRSIPFGQSFQEVIETELNAAQCAIVVWSRHSVDSGWVSAEADEARNRNIMVPVLIDDVSPPLVFRQLQTANLKDWDGEISSPIFKKLIGDVGALLGQPITQSRFSKPTSQTTEPLPIEKNHHMWPWFAGLAGMFAVAAMWFSNLQETPTTLAPTINEFRVESSHISVGDISSLIWNTSNASSVEIRELGDVAHSGSSRIRPEKSSVYTLIARNNKGETVQKTVEVIVEEQQQEEIITETVPDPRQLITMFNESFEEGHLDLAEQFLEQAIKMAPDNPEVLKIRDQLETERQAQQLVEEERQKEQKLAELERIRQEEASKEKEQQLELVELQRAKEEKQKVEEKERLRQEQLQQNETENARIAEIKKQEETERLKNEELQRRQQVQKLADQQRAKEAEERRIKTEQEKARKAEELRLAKIENQKKIEAKELEKQNTILTPASIAVQVDGVEKRFNREGLLASTLRENVVQQLKAAGFNVISLADTKNHKDSVVMLLAFKYIENTTAGFYSYTARTTISPASSNNNKSLWEKGQTGIARSVELKKVNGVFATNVEKFIRDHPEKGLEFTKK